MDSITHALYRAITAEEDRQRRLVDAGFGNQKTSGGLACFSEHPDVHQAYLGAASTDLYIALLRSPELLALQMEFLAAGFNVPATMSLEGVDVIISAGRIDIMANCEGEDGPETWTAILSRDDRKGGRKAEWSEQ